MSLSLEEKINMLPSLRATVEAHGLLAKKALGQNFLLDRNITGKTSPIIAAPPCTKSAPARAA